ncbi:MAG: polysaccharide deacetylase family protein [Deltaproteobacteria bacterium]|nr:polysaccharide deacetylase family protein [Deltaproteobacteria bacterium]
MRLRELTILQYQNVTTNFQLHGLWLSLDAFRKQMEYLKANNFKVLSIDDAISFMERKKETNNRRPVALTFDNGFMAFYKEVYPVLAEYRYPATVLISPDRVDTATTIGGKSVSYLSWQILRELVDSNITIGIYEDKELNINKILPSIVKEHIVDYKKKMEDKLGETVKYHGVKEGVPPSDIRSLIESTGFRAFLTQCPTNRKTDLFSIGRIQIDDEDFNIFLTKISNVYLFFKDRRSWKYIRKYHLDKLAHRVSEACNRLRG